MNWRTAACLLPLCLWGTPEIKLTSPTDYQVTQRQTRA